MSANLPAYLQGKQVPSLGQRLMANVGTVAPPRVSIKGNRFALIDAAGNSIPIPTLHLDVIIVDANDHVSKQYREGAWDPNDLQGPDCYSDNGVGPSTQAPKPQHGDCLTCRWNERGSAVSKMSGAAIKACRDQQNLAVMVAGDQRHAMYLFVVTPGSLKNFRNYMTMLTGNGVEPWQIVTRLEFDPNGVGVLGFKPSELGWVPEASVVSITAAIESRAALDIVGGRDKPRGTALGLTGPVTPSLQDMERKLGHEREIGKHPGLAAPYGSQAAPAAAPVPEPVKEKTPEEIEAEEYAAFKAAKAAAAAKEAAPRGRGRPKKEETVVAAGPIPAEIFTGQQQAPVDLPNPLQRPQPSAGSQPQFGIVQNPAPAGEEIGNVLDKLFASLPAA